MIARFDDNARFIERIANCFALRAAVDRIAIYLNLDRIGQADRNRLIIGNGRVERGKNLVFRRKRNRRVV